MAVAHNASVTTLQCLEAPFSVPGRGNGLVTMQVQPDHDPEAYGVHLLLPAAPLSAFWDFPLCSATVTTEQKGYGAMYGWIQVVRSSNATLTSAVPWDFDHYPVFTELVSPFATFGADPHAFDAPVYDISELDWSARTFLTYVNNTVLYKDVWPVVAFEWGFWIDENGVVGTKEARQLGLEAWNEQLPFLSGLFPEWEFFEG